MLYVSEQVNHLVDYQLQVLDKGKKNGIVNFEKLKALYQSKVKKSTCSNSIPDKRVVLGQTPDKISYLTWQITLKLPMITCK